MRATAAQALARAGLDWWRIQLFLRWGSKAILGYVQEAPLAASATLSGEVTERLALSELQRSIVDKETKLGDKDLNRIKTIINDILESRFAAMPPAQVISPEVVQAEVGLTRCLEEALELESKEVQPQLRFIRNGHPASMIVHVARDALRSVCGWEYAKSPWHTIVTGDEAKPRRCNACRCAF
jgi:hypothetical protein